MPRPPPSKRRMSQRSKMHGGEVISMPSEFKTSTRYVGNDEQGKCIYKADTYENKSTLYPVAKVLFDSNEGETEFRNAESLRQVFQDTMDLTKNGKKT